MDLIDQFLARYTKEYDFYSQAASITQQKLEAELQAAGVRCIVTARAKSFSSLEQKCRKREVSKGKYASIERIYDDIVDLAGARVALYFPGEIDQVDGTITRLFKIVEKQKIPRQGKGAARETAVFRIYRYSL
jgi:ppGpp synthetase/RelA/SpoT-type nucleotidyltranferase